MTQDIDVGEMTVDTLLDMRDFWRTESARLRDLAGKAEMEILRRLNDLGATVHASERFEARIVPGAKSYTYNEEALRQLLPLLRPEDKLPIYDETVTRTVVDKRQLNALEKRGGDFARIIGEAVVATEGVPSLKVTRLQGDVAA